MRALSVRQPWAWLIVNGIKPVENRTRATKHRGPFLVHASKQLAFSPADMADFRRVMRVEAGIVIPADLPVGGIVGMVDLVDCVTVCEDPDDAEWHEPGMYAWVLRNARPLPFTPISGRLGWFDVHGVPPLPTTGR